jgi:hypothetical protein
MTEVMPEDMDVRCGWCGQLFPPFTIEVHERLCQQRCQTCQHWHESADGDCLADYNGPLKSGNDWCPKWMLARELRP